MEEQGGQGKRVADFAFLSLCSALSLFFGWSVAEEGEDERDGWAEVGELG